MKYMLTTLLMIYLGIGNEVRDQDWKRLRLQGKVKSMQETTYKAVDLEKSKAEGKNQIYTYISYSFNKKGKQTEVIAYDHNEQIKFIYEYNEQNKSTKTTEYTWTRGGKPKFAHIRKYYYDSKDSLVAEIERDSNGNLRHKILYEFDSRGYKTKTAHYDANDSLWQEVTAEYDKKGNKLWDNVYYRDNTKRFTRYEYDNEGREIKSKVYNAKGGLQEEVLSKYKQGNDGSVEKRQYTSQGRLLRLIKYNNRGNEVENIRYDIYGSGTVLKTLHTYNNQGVKVEKAQFFRDVASSLTKYDSRGNEVESIQYDDEGNKSWITLNKYDSKGSEVEQTIYDASDSVEYKKYWAKYDKRGNKYEWTAPNFEGGGDLYYKYTYDKNNNWVTKISVWEGDNNNKYQALTERKIEYY
jgi:hypothetical protein